MLIHPWDRLQSLLPPLSQTERQELEDSIKQEGVKYPILVLPDGRIIDGHHRWLIAGKGCPFEVHDMPEARAFDLGLALNLARRQLSFEQKKEMMRQLRQQGKSQKEVAELLDVSHQTISVWENGNNSNIGNTSMLDLRTSIPKEERNRIFERHRSGETQTEIAADYKVSRERIGQIARQVEARQRQPEPVETPELPQKKYRCLVIDPPWPMKKIEREVMPDQGLYLDYPTMTIEEIGGLDVVSLADPQGCHLYLWTTHKFLPDALEIIKHWGFRYQCILTWVKNVGFTPFSWMYSTELVMFGRIGNLDLLRKGLRLDFNAKRREHSRKPDIFYNLVTQASPEPRLDLFARERRDGFEQWGTEHNPFSTTRDKDLLGE